MKKTFGILGLGRFGTAIVRTLAKYEYEVIAVDINEEKVTRLEDSITRGVVGDITDYDLLKAIGLGECDAVVIATGSNLESSVLAVMNCKRLGIKNIVAKALSQTSQEVLQQIGADEVVLPERETGVRIAKLLMRRYIEDIVKLDDNVSLIEFYPPKSWVGKTIQDLDLRNRYDINIIGTRADKKARLDLSITTELVLTEDIMLVGITESERFEDEDFLEQIK